MKKEGVSRRRAFAIATAGLQKAGDLKSGSQELTEKGRRRNAMTRAERERTR